MPDIDDGYVKEKKFPKMMSIYHKAGVTDIVFTPHVNKSCVDTHYDRIDETFARCRELASAEGIRCHLGSELYLTDRNVCDGIPLWDKYQLVEFNTQHQPRLILDRLERIKAQGLRIVIAHIERYRWLQVKSFLFDDIMKFDPLIQVNVSGIPDAQEYLESGVVDLIATDNHGDKKLPKQFVSVMNDYPAIDMKMEKLHP